MCRRLLIYFSWERSVEKWLCPVVIAGSYWERRSRSALHTCLRHTLQRCHQQPCGGHMPIDDRYGIRMAARSRHARGSL